MKGVFIGWSLAGCPAVEGRLPAREAKPIGAVIHVRGLIRKFDIRYRDNWGDDRFPWKLRERIVMGTKAPQEHGEDLDEFPSLREAMREAVKLAKS